MATSATIPRSFLLRVRFSFRFAATIALILASVGFQFARPPETVAEVDRSDAVDYGGGTYAVIASMFGAPADGFVGNKTASGQILAVRKSMPPRRMPGSSR
jgi:hypothetical protein